MRFVVAVLLGTLACSSLPQLAIAAPAPSAATALSGLQAALADQLAGWDGDYAVSVTDLQTGAHASVNGDRPQSAASTIKLFILMQVALDLAAGRYSDADAEPLVQAMMTVSDNEAARELIALAGDGDIPTGIGRINALMQQLGMSGSVLNCPPDYPDDCVVPDDNYLTTDDLSTALSELYQGRALPPGPTAYVLQHMTLPEAWQTAPLSDPLPDDVIIYHKPGWLDDAWNDAAIVVFPSQGRKVAYVLAYLGSDAPSQDEAAGHLTDVSAAVWQDFAARYPEQPASLYFAATGHTVQGAFLSYWQAHGLDLGDEGVSARESLALFGYPITDARRDPATGDTVQYFERARFEYHPELKGTPYAVELGLLGDTVTAARRGAPPFQPVVAASDESCDFMAETGHRLCNGFRAFWQQNGGLPVFGYPISEEFSERNPSDGKTYTVQYFERARFEYHPEFKGTPYEVELGLLGRQVTGLR